MRFYSWLMLLSVSLKDNKGSYPKLWEIKRMRGYKIVFTYMDSSFLDFREFCSDNVTDAISQFHSYWDNRDGFKVVSVIDCVTGLSIPFRGDCY